MGEMREWRIRNVAPELDKQAHVKAAAEGSTFQAFVRGLVKEAVGGTRNGTRKVSKKMSQKVSQAQEADDQRGPDDQKQDDHAALTAETPKDPATVDQSSQRVSSGNGKHPLDDPSELSLESLAVHVLEVLCLQSTQQTRDAIAQRIHTKAQTDAITLVASHDRVLLELAPIVLEGKPLPFECSEQEPITGH